MKLTIITVCYNSGKTIKDTLESVGAIKNNDVEYLIIDGGSTDDTLQIINEYRDIVDQLVSEPDDGIYYAMNKGLKLASGKWIYILNSDDYLSAVNFPEVLGYLDSSVSDIVYGNIVRISGDTRKTVGVSKPKKLSYLMRGVAVYHPAMFITKEVYSESLGFDTKYKLASDYKVMLMAYINKKRFKYIDRNISFYDVGGATANNIHKSWRELSNIQIEAGVPHIKAKYNYYLLVCKRKFLKLIGYLN